MRSIKELIGVWYVQQQQQQQHLLVNVWSGLDIFNFNSNSICFKEEEEDQQRSGGLVSHKVPLRSPSILLLLLGPPPPRSWRRSAAGDSFSSLLCLAKAQIINENLDHYYDDYYITPLHSSSSLFLPYIHYTTLVSKSLIRIYDSFFFFFFLSSQLPCRITTTTTTVGYKVDSAQCTRPHF